MKSRCRELIEIGDREFSKRFPLLTLWQTFAENFYPIRADFTRARYISEEFASYLMTGRPVLAHRELSSSLSAILRPPGMPWSKAQTDIDAVNKDRSSAAWLAGCDDVMRGVFNDRRSQFKRATKEGDADYVLTGQCVIEPRINAMRDGMLFRCWHLRDCVWTESAELVIDSFHRKWAPEARQLQRFGASQNWQMSSQLDDKVKKDPGRKINCRAIVLPADEYDSFGKYEEGYTRKRNPKMPFVSIVVDEEHDTILEEVPQRKLGYVVPRWVTIGGFSQYAYSPSAIVALPDGRMLQQMTLMLLEIGSKIVDPPMKAVGDAIQGGVNLYAGAINWVDPDYDERTGSVLEPMQFHPEGLNWGTEYEDKIEKVINEAFYLNVLNLPEYDEKEMTAFEYGERMKQFIRRATPLFDPIREEYNGALCDDVFDTLLHMGAFGSPLDMPPALRGREVSFKFRDPLVAAEEEGTTNSFKNLAQLLGAAMQIDPTLAADVDTDTAFRDAVPGTGAKPTWLRDRDQADQLKAQQRQQQQQDAAAARLGAVADNGSKMANAVENVGDAATALQKAGLTQ